MRINAVEDRINTVCVAFFRKNYKYYSGVRHRGLEENHTTTKPIMGYGNT